MIVSQFLLRSPCTFQSLALASLQLLLLNPTSLLFSALLFSRCSLYSLSPAIPLSQIVLVTSSLQLLFSTPLSMLWTPPDPLYIFSHLSTHLTSYSLSKTKQPH